jgi:hypothetical protein
MRGVVGAVSGLVLLLGGCFDVTVETLQVGPEVCDFAEELAAAPKPELGPPDPGLCEGYIAQRGLCLTFCDEQRDCRPRHWCDLDSGVCMPQRTAGPCDVDVECDSGICLCGKCADNDKIGKLVEEAITSN